MKIAYIILAHTNPEQVNFLISRINDYSNVPDLKTGVYLHIDKRVDIKPFRENIKQSNVIFTKRYTTKWGSFNLVKSVLNIIKSNHYTEQEYDYTILLSGQDLPVQKNNAIRDFLSRNNGKSYIEFNELPTEKLTNGGLERFRRFHFYIGNSKFTYPPYEKQYSRKQKIFYMFLSLFLPKQRDIDSKIKLYYGSQWWILHKNVIDYIRDYLKNNKWYEKFYRFVWISDEHFFQTIILNNPDKIFREGIQNATLKYMNWTKKNVRLPAILDEDDVHTIIRGEWLFARKFGTDYKKLYSIIINGKNI